MSAALALGLAAAPLAAGAQALATLHVRSFDMSADRYEAKVGETIQVRITALVSERIAQLNDVTLPDLTGFDLQGDERTCAPAAGGGTRCVETVSLAPQQPGDLTIAPATLDAIDGTNGKPSRFTTGNISIKVAGDPGAAYSNWLPAVGSAFFGVFRLLIMVALVGVALAAIVWAFGRPKRPAVPAEKAELAAVAGPAAPLPVEDFGLLIARLHAEPTRANVVAVREALRKRIGARPEETYNDLLARRAAGDDRQLTETMAAIERAAFCEKASLADAVQDALRVLQR